MTLGGLKLSPNDLAAPGIYEVASQIEPGKLNLRIEGFEDWASDLEGTVDLRQLAIDSNGNVVALWMYLDVARPRGANPELSDPPLLVEVRYGMPEGTIGNQPPLVTAGRNDKWMQRQRAILTGNVVDDGDQMPALTWTRISGPGDVQFADPNARVTEVNFDVPGTYVFRLTADDGTHVVSDDVTIEKSPLETSLIIRGLPLTAGASTFATVYTAGDIGIYDEYPGSDTSVSLSIRPDGDDIVGLDISSDGQPFRTGVYHNSPLIWNRARARLWLNDPSGPILAYDFVIHEIAFDENKKLTALHAEFRSDRLEAAQEVWAEIRFNALDLSSTGPNLAPRVTVLAPHTVPNWLFKLDGNVFDDQLPANQPIHVTWEQIDGPSPARMDDAHCLQPEVEVEKDGVYRFRLTASDGEFSASAESTVVVGSGSRKYRGVITFFGSAVGRFDLTRRTSESFTARLTLPGTSFPIIGTFENGSWRTSYSNADGDTVEYELKIDDSGTGILGYISIGDLIYELSGDQTQATGLAASKQKAERAGTYNLLLNPTASTAPRGFGFARVIVRGSGAARGTGRLPDGTSFSFSSTSTVGDNLPFFAPMYGREGGLAGEFGFKTSETNGQSRIGASLLWMHPDRPKYPPYTEYFSSRVNASGDPYSPPVRGTNFLSQKPGAQDALLKVLFDDGELLRIPLRFNSDGTVLPLVNSPGFHFKLKPKTGTFRGAFTDPRDGKQRSFAGIIDSAFAVGGGYFITPEGAGRIQMDSVPVP